LGILGWGFRMRLNHSMLYRWRIPRSMEVLALRTTDACRLAPSRFGMEHPRPYDLGCHRLSGASAGETTDHRKGKSSVGETSLVHQPMAGQAPRRSYC